MNADLLSDYRETLSLCYFAHLNIISDLIW